MGNLDDVLGTLLIGSWGASGLFMLEFTWAFQYYRNYWNEDRPSLGILVAGTIVVDLLSLIAGYAAVYFYCASHWGDVEYLKHQYWPVPVYTIAQAVVTAIVQGLLVSRYIRLSRNWYVGLILIIFILVALGSGFAMAILAVKWSDLEQRALLEPALRAWLIMDVVTDACISLSLIYELHGQRTGLRTTNTLIHRLTVITIQSGTIPALCAIGALIAYYIRPTTNISMFFIWLLPRFYVLSLLYSLNIRQSIRERARIRGSRSSAADYTIGGIHALRTTVIEGKDSSSKRDADKA